MIFSGRQATILSIPGPDPRPRPGKQRLGLKLPMQVYLENMIICLCRRAGAGWFFQYPALLIEESRQGGPVDPV